MIAVLVSSDSLVSLNWSLVQYIVCCLSVVETKNEDQIRTKTKGGESTVLKERSEFNYK